MGLKIDPFEMPAPERDEAPGTGDRRIVLGGGCFWCTEAVYLQLDGVKSVRPGYAGGTRATADYKTVCTGGTDHAEVIEIVYDRARIGLGTILQTFFSIAHDPTQKDRQGNDIGRQYRSVVFYADEEQRDVTRAYIRQIGPLFDAPIVTEIAPLVEFFEAEAYHHNYAALNPEQPYIRAAAAPKVAKLKKSRPDLLKGAKADVA
jgi:peptide-methionine (S)-S-oxide reductase